MAGTAVVVVSSDPRWSELTVVDGVAGGRGDDRSYRWAAELDPTTWYVPVVLPGASAERFGEPLDEDRAEGQMYRESWDLAMSPRPPGFVVVDSFNNWWFGTQIEPAMIDELPHRAEPPYRSYEPLPPDGYLALTHELIDTYA